MKKSTFQEIFYKNAGYVAVILVSLAYGFSSLVMISKTGRSIYEIVGSGVLSLLVGVMINGVFRSIGIRRGDEDERTNAACALHSRVVGEIAPYTDRLDGFCKKESAQAQKDIRKRILNRCGLSYEECFDENGVGRGCKFDKWNKNAAYKRAVRVRIKPLTPSSLTSGGQDLKDPFDFGKSKRQYSGEKSASDVVTRIMLAILFGFFGVTLSSEIDIGAIIWNCLQIVMYICGGVIQMYNSYMWIVEDYRLGVIRRVDLLEKFKASCIEKE